MESNGTRRRMSNKLDGSSKKSDSALKSVSGNAGTSDGESPNSNGEPPPGTRPKHRIKLWDSFLQKTRKIRVRSKDRTQRTPSSKLEKRASSHPNISSYSANPDNHLKKEAPTLPSTATTTTKLQQSHTNRVESKRDMYIHQRAVSRSSTSLNDSPTEPNSLTAGGGNKMSSKVSFENGHEIKGTENRRSEEYSVRTNGTRHTKSENHITNNRDSTGTFNNEDDDKEDNDKGNDDNEEDEDDDDEQEDNDEELERSLPQVSKSRDSLLSVTPSASPSRDSALRTNIYTDSRVHEPFLDDFYLDPVSEVRQHYSHSAIKNNSQQFFDCHDYLGDFSMTSSSSNDSSPIHRLKETRKDSTETGVKDDVFNKHHSSSSLAMSAGLPGYADYDIDEHVTYVVDLDASSKSGRADRDTSHLPAVTVQSLQEPAAGGQQVSPQHNLLMLNIHLQEGRDLVVRDTCGTSDPYVKFKIGTKWLYKSRTVFKNLNPRWDEQFSIPVDDLTKPLVIKVFDYDRTWNDDPMGGADVDITTLEMNKKTELKLTLGEKDNEEYMGYLLLSCTLMPKSEEITKEQFLRRSTRTTDSSRKIKMQLWNGVVNIVLVEGCNLVAMDDNGLSDPYVKFRLGVEKYRSKLKNKTLNPRWVEQFDLHLYEDQTTQLEIAVYDHDTRGKDDFMGRAVIDLSLLEKDKTHNIEQELEDGAGTIRLLLTVSGTMGSDLTSDLANYMPDATAKDDMNSRYGLLNSLRIPDDIGHLEVKVFRAHGLQSADFGGLSDPFCVLELVNDRVQTHTEYKTLNPEWAKVFTFQVKDIHSVLEVTVYDEDRNKKVEFLGKVAIPLLRIRNDERRWYALKDRKMLHKTKGAIFLEMNFVFNHIKAGIRTVNPSEPKVMLPEDKFKIAIMKENITRVTNLIGVLMDYGKFIQSCFDWQSPSRTVTAFIIYLVIVWNFELYMLPISLLLIFMKNLVVAKILGTTKEPVEDDFVDEDDEDEDDDKDKQEEKKTIVDRYHAVQEVCVTVQQALDMVASLGERVKNTFAWSVPWLSTLAVIALVVVSIVLFYIPLRYLLLAWGINKFTKKLRAPDAINNNELLDFLSRVPSDNELLQYRELRPDIPANTPSMKKKRS